MEGFLADGQKSLRSQIFGRYKKFLQKLLLSPSKEIRFLSKVLISDPRSTVAKNIWYLNHLTKADILKDNSVEFKIKLPVKIVPTNEQYRVSLLTTLLEVRETKQYQKLNSTKKQIHDLIDSLCIS